MVTCVPFLQKAATSPNDQAFYSKTEFSFTIQIFFVVDAFLTSVWCFKYGSLESLDGGHVYKHAFWVPTKSIHKFNSQRVPR